MIRISLFFILNSLASSMLLIGCSAISPASPPCRFGPKFYSDGSTVVLKDRGVMCICGDGSWTCLPAMGLGAGGLGGGAGGGVPGPGPLPPGMPPGGGGALPPGIPLDPSMGGGSFGNGAGY